MAFTVKSIVPWGRSFEEYRRMFSLSARDLNRRILSCGDGPAGFNGEMAKRGKRVVSIDPIYRFTAREIEARIGETYDEVMAQMLANRDDYLWTTIPSPEELGRVRMHAMREFLADFEAGKRAGRYVTAELPSLPFASGQFDLALSSHFLFLYSDRLSLEFHLDAITEMCRVAGEARIFPLLDVGGRECPYLPELVAQLRKRGFRVSIRRVNYEFQRGGNRLLSVRPATGPAARAGRKPGGFLPA